MGTNICWNMSTNLSMSMKECECESSEAISKSLTASMNVGMSL